MSAGISTRPLAPLAACLALAAFLLYLPSAWHGWILYDDAQYVFENRRVLEGLSAEGFRWAWTSLEAGNWHPLTWLSHQAVVELFGPGPGPQHVVNAGLHACAVALAFLALAAASGARWPSAFAAALLALHPVHVESVAWIAERKDVLSSALALGALCAYVRYSRAPSPARMTLVAFLFALALAAKPMPVGLPFALLLWDLWPLGRMRGRDGASAGPHTRLVLEKLPLFALAALSAWMTWVAQSAAGALQALERVPLGQRAANALVSWARYLATLAWPSGLALPYPWRAPEAGETLLALALLAGLCFLAWRQRVRRPWLLVGWLWFLGLTVPVIGLVQVGHQARADRYLYLPALGLYWCVGWTAAELMPRARRLLPASAAALLLALALLSARQLRLWRDAVPLFEHTLAVTGANATAHRVLASAFLRRGESRRAEEHLRAVLALAPAHPEARVSLTRVLAGEERFEEALELLDDARSAQELLLRARLNARTGRLVPALEDARAAVRSAPSDPEAAFALGLVLAASGDEAGAEMELERASALQPESAATWLQLGLARVRRGRLAEAESALREAARLAPGYEERLALGSLLGELGRGEEACRELAEAVRMRPAAAEARWRLGGALLLAGRLGEAGQAARELESLDPELARRLRELVEQARPAPPTGVPQGAR